MKLTIIILLTLLTTITCVLYAQNQTPADHSTDTATPAHQTYLPDTIQWQDGPPSLPPGAKFAILEGDPSKEGYFAMRIWVPDGYRIAPHWHPNVERITIITGTLNLGMGEQFDTSTTQSLPAGSYSFMPPGMRHFAWSQGETVIQIATLGPWAINYINPADDPRQK